MPPGRPRVGLGAAGRDRCAPLLPGRGCDNLQHRIDHIGHIPVAHGAEDGERDLTQVLAVGDREILRFEAEGAPVIGVDVERDEVHAGADVPLPQPLDELVPADAEPVQIQPQLIEMPRVADSRPDSGSLEFLTFPEGRMP